MTNKTNAIFLHKVIKAISDSMVKVFIPLLILKSTNMMYAILYICSYYLFCTIFNIIFRKILQKYGIFAIILHSFPIIASQLLLSINLNWWLILIIAILMAISQSLYSVPINILFSLTDKSVNVAKFDISTNIGKVIFILLSGYILGSDITNSVLIMSISSSILYIASSIPLLYGYKVLKTEYNNASNTTPQLDKKGYKLFNLFHIQFGIYQSVIDTALPLYLYLNNLTFTSVTIVLVLIEICKIGANLLAKFLIGKNLSKISIIISILISILSFFIIIFIKNAFVLYICSCLLGISFPLLFVPMFSIFVKKVLSDNNQFNGLTYRDVYIFSCRSFIYFPYILLPNLVVQFVLGIICSTSIIYSTNKIIQLNNYSTKG